jgi:NAD(P)-dependent dehydrogenase (short-subunit alcohol dehydrogenase family)
MNGKTILITGGSQGLGAELARRLDEQGANLIVLALDEAPFKKLNLKNARFFAVDVGDVEQVKNFAEKLGGEKIDILISNAGKWTDDEIESRDISRRRAAIDTNLIGTINITEALLPLIEGQIVFVISNAAIVGMGGSDGARWATYNASKWGARGYVQSLSARLKLDGGGVKIGAIYPGGFESNLYESAERSGDAHNQPWMMATETVANAVLFMLNQPADANVDELVVTKYFGSGR